MLETMATQALPRKRSVSSRGRRKKKAGLHWLSWWPLAIALIALPFAVRTAEILPLMGAAGLTRLRLLYPFALLAQQHLGLSESLAESVSQALMYAQFPLYALLFIFVHRWKSFPVALCVVLALHLMAAAVVWLLHS